MIVILTMLAIFTAGTAAAQARRVLTLDDERLENFQLRGYFSPHWSGGAILAVEDNPSDAPMIVRIGRNGHVERINFKIPDGRHITVLGLAGATDGRIAVIGSAHGDDGGATTFLALIAADRQSQIVVQLWPYGPSVVTFAPDGAVWTIGWVREGERVAADSVLKRFDRSGALIATTQLFTGKDEKLKGFPLPPPRTDMAHLSRLRASKDRIGWLMNDNNYIEFFPDGRVSGWYSRPDCGGTENELGYLALSETNEVIVRISNCKQSTYLQMNRETKAWRPVEGGKQNSLKWEIPLGFDGETLVSATADGSVRRYNLSQEELHTRDEV
jgi:WD40 repeat protein